MTEEIKINTGTRIGSMLLDHVFMTMIAVLFFIPVMINVFAGAFTISHEETSAIDFGGSFLYIGLIGFALYFCKDSINGRSLAKRITKLQVVNNLTGEAASAVRCFIRNIFCIIWPVEALVTLSNPSRRIGDLVAGTKVVNYYPALNDQPKINAGKIIVSLILAYSLMLLIVQPFKNMDSTAGGVKYVKNSYNETESKALERLYAQDSVGNYLSASVKVYDSVANEKLKYVSVIYLYKENYFDYPDRLNELEHQSLQLLYTVYPEQTFTGRAQFIYKKPNLMMSYSMRMGVKGEVLDKR